jgi:hypothetical protein
METGIGCRTEYSGTSSDRTALSGGMHFRLRHLNTGRLIVSQSITREEFSKEDNKKVTVNLLTLGLSEHLGINIEVESRNQNSSKATLKCADVNYMKKLEENSVFRLVSTGVDTESGILQNTSVQIQHV